MCIISGGVEKSQYGQLPKQILSRHGFEGCLSSLDLSGESTNLISDAVVPSSLVESGCDMYASMHAGKKCTHDLCSNHGTCVQQWNSYTCDCDMTSFTGPTCNEGKNMNISCARRTNNRLCSVRRENFDGTLVACDKHRRSTRWTKLAFRYFSTFSFAREILAWQLSNDKIRTHLVANCLVSRWKLSHEMTR